MLQCLKDSKENKNEKEIYPPPYRLKAFTLSEVLITLVIIGVIAAITVPNIIQSSQDKELHSMYKKNISVIENALNLAQVEEGTIGDNSVVFIPSNGNNASYESAKRFAKYLNVAKICKNQNENGCSGAFYKTTAANSDDGRIPTDMPRLILADGSIYTIAQFETCDTMIDTCAVDEFGHCKKDENGNDIQGAKYERPCANIYIDVNGAKAPNKMGKDSFLASIWKNSISVSTFAPSGGSASIDIITGKI